MSSVESIPFLAGRTSTTMTFRLEDKIDDSAHKRLYSVKYCNNLPSYSDYFAAVGRNSASIYRKAEGTLAELVQAYVDEDESEYYYCCTWGANVNGLPLLLIGGERGIVKGINCINHSLDALLIGHGNSVNDIKVHPVDDNLCFTASKDESIRMWNLVSCHCIAIFAGDKGHRLDVLTIDINPLGNCFASAGMDTSIKIWNLQETQLQDAIQESRRRAEHTNEVYSTALKTLFVQFPIFSTTQ
eukprot:gene12698-26752_t